MQNFDQASAFIAALTGSDPVTTTIDARAIHDTDKGVQAQSFRGLIADLWSTLVQWNNVGYGIFVNVNEMDGQGRKLSNVKYCRVALTDLDSISAPADYSRIMQWSIVPAFAVESSPSKYHTYWQINHYVGNDRYSVIQNKLRTMFGGDPRIGDPTRVMRLPGTLHMKNPAAPFLVHCWWIGGPRIDASVLETALAHVEVIGTGAGMRHPLGDPELAAPSLDWVKYALTVIDPNELDRGAWIAMTAAIKQSLWTHTNPTDAFAIWSDWCARYEKNDPAENLKQWNDITDTQLGWHSIVNRHPGLRASVKLDGVDKSHMVPTVEVPSASVPSMPLPAAPATDCSGEILTDYEQREWFKGCVAIESQGEIMTPSGRFMNATKFNLKYGGKQFVISSTGKTTNEAWAAATRSTLWTVPKVDHTRFLPDRPFGDIVPDQLRRNGVNTYIPIKIRAIPGDVSLWLRHMELMLPVENDRRILYEYFAHSVKYPGEKIPWAPMIQSAEGVGKGFIGETMETIIGEMYCYRPKATELVKSGATFNGWMRSKLFIIVDEIKIDEKRELVEILKPMISERRIEVQSKGIDQEMEDNPTQWLFFSNFMDAIPLSKNGRRYAIFYSAIQSVADLMTRGMDDAYFARLFGWLHADGAAHIAHWLLNYPIARGAIPMRAPDTSSTAEARRLSRGPLERMIDEAIEDKLPGFLGGWLSSTAIVKRAKDTGAVRGAVSPTTIETIAKAMGYSALGRALRPYMQEDREQRAYLFNLSSTASVGDYGRVQGWE